MGLDKKDMAETKKNIKNENMCGDRYFIKREVGKSGSDFLMKQTCAYCPDTITKETKTDKVTNKEKDVYTFSSSNGKIDPYFANKAYSELSEERKDDLLMCGKLLNDIWKENNKADIKNHFFITNKIFSESDIYTEDEKKKDNRPQSGTAWKVKQQEYNIDMAPGLQEIMGPECNTDQIDALNKYNAGNEETKKEIRKKTRSVLSDCTINGEPAWRQTIPKDIRGSRYHGGYNFKQCVYGKLRIRDGDNKHTNKTNKKEKEKLIDEKLNLLMNAPYHKIHTCLEETDVHKDCRNGYSDILLSLMGKDTSEGPPGIDTPLTETQFKDRLARRHLVHLAGRMEYNDCGYVSNNTEVEKDKYDNPMYNVSFNVNIIETIMGFIGKLIGQSDYERGEFNLIESGMRLATFFVLALILYMFTRLLLK